MVHYVTGNLLEADVQYICHQVNCQGKMNSGIAKSIKEKWPIVFGEYTSWTYCHGNDMLGSILIVPVANKQSVINMAAQKSYGYDNRRYTSYDAFWSCLGEIRENIPRGATLGFPARIGSCRGGANWEVIRTMIEQALGSTYEVYIYDFPGGN